MTKMYPVGTQVTKVDVLCLSERHRAIALGF